MSSLHPLSLWWDRAPRQSAFTLIELLVVVAIIALLVAILLPSLSRARLQAKIVLCKANMAQISTMTANYQAENTGFVPIMYNYYAYGHGRHDAPARACWLSVALRDYYPGTARLKERTGGRFDPNKVWYPETGLREEYERTLLPEFFCLSVSAGDGSGAGGSSVGPVVYVLRVERPARAVSDVVVGGHRAGADGAVSVAGGSGCRQAGDREVLGVQLEPGGRGDASGCQRRSEPGRVPQLSASSVGAGGFERLANDESGHGDDGVLCAGGA